ncbi:mycothione reductase [Williamsia sterculiae]|uniref:Mycothione reductase n=1 Tax=Williamsia sterculiae TaxID=1344003 RepID=A0A1N7GED2_9NOCA|nr:mycothione reductase [Williamsia sterculiae]SIS10898.1 mycothione reductase [Williamsia sterculiae]
MTGSGPTSDDTVVDVAVIGTGSGNTFIDDRYADLRVAMFEKGVFGGTCLNVGCIPTKMFVYAAEVAETIRESERYGIDASVNKVRWRDIVNRVFGRIDPITAGGEDYRAHRSPNVTLYRSEVRFVGSTDDGYHRLRTESGDEITAKQVVIAAGSRPVIPDVIARSGVPFHTNDDVMRLAELPEHLIIVGGGYIAAEFAHVFGSLGSEVSIIGRSGRLLRTQDETISDRFTEIARDRFDVHLDAQVTQVSQRDEGVIAVSLADGTEVTGDALLVAAGRISNADTLDLSTIGVELDDRGRVPVDGYGRVPSSNVWALGDVSSDHQLKHVANYEARVVGANVLRGWDADDLVAFGDRPVPSAVFTHPQIASVGLTESAAHDAGLDITVKVQDYGDVAYGWAMEDTTGLCKVIADRRSGRLVGVHVIGPQAPTVIQPAIQAMTFGLPAEEMARGQYWIHPAMPEVLENALLGLDLPKPEV